MLIPNAGTCSRRSAALATYAENRDCPRCPGNSLSAGDEGRSLPNSTARNLTEPARTADAKWQAVAVSVASAALTLQTRINPLLMILVGGILGGFGLL
jgi:hypothetical protein